MTKEQHDLSVPVRDELVALRKALVLTTKTISKLIGDPRSVVRHCKGCGRSFTARGLRDHACKVSRSKR